MHIEHIAIWTPDLERLKQFYERYGGATAGARYTNPRRQFTSYFLTFPAGARLELMHAPQVVDDRPPAGQQRLGLAHLALAVGSREAVDALTARLRADGYPILDGPRLTGDGYYESVALDPDGNWLEITI